MWQVSAVTVVSSGTLFAIERICTAISGEVTENMVWHNYYAGHAWQDYDKRAPLLWLPKRARVLFSPLLRFWQGFFDFRDFLTGVRFTKVTLANFTILACVGLITAILTAARVFLVVEAFISLRSMPPQMHKN